MVPSTYGLVGYLKTRKCLTTLQKVHKKPKHTRVWDFLPFSCHFEKPNKSKNVYKCILHETKFISAEFNERT